MAYQLVASITFNQVMVETVLYGADIEQKKKQILCQLGDIKMSPPVDEKIRKIIQDIKVFMRNDQVELLHQVLRLGGRKKDKIKQVCGIFELLVVKIPLTGKNYKTVEKKEQSVARRECLCGRGQK